MAIHKPLVVGHWIARLVAAAILVMGAMPKFTGGAAELAAKLPGGTTTTLAIGAAEIMAVVLMLAPKTTLFGSAFAAIIMLGAVGSHLLGPVGLEGDFASMLPMAVVALLSATAASAIAWRRGIRFIPVKTPPKAA